MSLQRLDKTISSQMNISRKDVKSGIRKGLASVNDKVIHDGGFLIDPDESKVVYNGQMLNYKRYIYLMMNKPKGVLSASQDKSRETVVSLVPNELRRNGLFPVGRLDRDTTGLILITDDGDFAHRIISPKKEIYKTYIAELDGGVTAENIEMFKNGITLADGTLCRRAELKPLSGNCVEIKICEGRYHQIKRMFGVVGLGVNELSRVAVGGLKLPENLGSGECRELTESELSSLYNDNL